MTIHIRESDSTDREDPSAPGPAELCATGRPTDLAFVGKATTRVSGAGDWGLADSRQRNLVASKLRSLAVGVGAA